MKLSDMQQTMDNYFKGCKSCSGDETVCQCARTDMSDLVDINKNRFLKCFDRYIDNISIIFCLAYLIGLILYFAKKWNTDCNNCWWIEDDTGDN